MKLAILAGGRGTRLRRTDLPKPMVRINGKPILEYQIQLGKRYGLTDIYILSGFKSSVIQDYFGDGSQFGVNITHIVESQALGTAGSIKQLEPLFRKRFMVFYGDTVMDINLEKMIEKDRRNPGIATLLVHPNDHPHDSDLLDYDEDSKAIVSFTPKPHDSSLKPNIVNAALYILSEKIFRHIPAGKSTDFGRDIFPALLKKGCVMKAYKSAEYIKYMGTPSRLIKTEQDLKNGKVGRMNCETMRKAIFLDRDGVINKEKNNLSEASEFELIDSAGLGIQMINKSEFLSIVVTNQPVLAKGFCTFSDLKDIHNKMEHLLGLENAYLDGVYFCPHHPEKGHHGEIQSLKIKCNCRKPELSMILKAKDEFNIDIENSFIVGDTTTDIKTGINAGLNTVLVDTGFGGRDKKYNVQPTFRAKDLLDAVRIILQNEITDCNI